MEPSLCARLVFYPGAYLMRFPDFFNFIMFMIPLPAFLPEQRWLPSIASAGGRPFPDGMDVEPDS